MLVCQHFQIVLYLKTLLCLRKQLSNFLAASWCAAGHWAVPAWGRATKKARTLRCGPVSSAPVHAGAFLVKAKIPGNGLTAVAGAVLRNSWPHCRNEMQNRLALLIDVLYKTHVCMRR